MKLITDKEIKGISVHEPKANEMKLLIMYYLQRNEEWKAKQFYKHYRYAGGKLTFPTIKKQALK